MLRDYLIQRPLRAGTYELHMLVERLTEGHTHLLWRDEHDRVRVRTDVVLDSPSTEAPMAVRGLYSFQLVAAVRYKANNATRYFESGQRQPRIDWLEREGARHGFEVIDVNVSARKDEIVTKIRSFAIDETSFVGVLRVLDPGKFNHILQQGIGAAGKAYGRGLMTVTLIHATGEGD